MEMLREAAKPEGTAIEVSLRGELCLAFPTSNILENDLAQLHLQLGQSRADVCPIPSILVVLQCLLPTTCYREIFVNMNEWVFTWHEILSLASNKWVSSTVVLGCH